jgi:hypothetical protein
MTLPESLPNRILAIYNHLMRILYLLQEGLQKGELP